jgi:peptidoglycan/LPS O-acetylase OafA/YrhL
MRTGFAALLMLALTATLAHAQAAGSPRHNSHPVVWTAVGAGGGFALGLLAGLRAFDDDVESEQKVWATAVAGAAAGGLVAYMLSRQHTRARPAAPARLTEAEIRALSSQFPRPRSTPRNPPQPFATPRNPPQPFVTQPLSP